MAEQSLLAAAELMRGEIDTAQWFRSVPRSAVVNLRADTAAIICRGLSGNVTVLRTREGLVVCDTGSVETGPMILEAIRRYDPDTPVHTVLYTHGHFDHVNGMRLFDEEAERNGHPRPRVLAHENVLRRFERYALTAPHNAAINKRQYTRAKFPWPTEYRRPDLLIRDRLELEIAGEHFEFVHGRGETDDHVWLHAPERSLVVAGDFVIWAAPNAGNPQKAQRYAADWAAALRAMMARNPEILVPGHGPPIVGANLVRTHLDASAAWLESLHAQTVDLLNAGRRLDEILHAVKVPEALSSLPWLKATYDDPEFVVRNIFRLYAGWWDGNPANLKPAPERALASELAALTGGAHALASRAEQLAAAGNLRLAAHLVEFAALAAPDDKGIHGARARIYDARTQAETAQMAKGIFSDAANESRQRADGAA